VSGSLNWLKHDEEGQPLGGATFEVCRTHTYNSASDDFDDTADVCVSVTDNVAPDVDTDDGLFKLEGLVLGRYTVEETKAPLGFKIDPAVRSIDLTTDAPNGTLLDPWVDPALQPAIQIVKTASPENGPPRDVTYTYVVTNIGEVRLENILVTDDVLGTIGTIPGLDPGESATLTTTVAVDETSPVRNVATACGDPVVEGQIVGPEVCDDDDAVISVVLGTRVVRLPRTGLPLRMMTLLAAVLVWLGTAFLGTQDRLIVARRRRDP
jgi:hypothetical protein